MRCNVSIQIVKNEFFPGEILAQTNRRYYPTDVDVRNNIYKASVKLMLSKVDEENLGKKIIIGNCEWVVDTLNLNNFANRLNFLLQQHIFRYSLKDLELFWTDGDGWIGMFHFDSNLKKETFFYKMSLFFTSCVIQINLLLELLIAAFAITSLSKYNSSGIISESRYQLVSRWNIDFV